MDYRKNFILFDIERVIKLDIPDKVKIVSILRDIYFRDDYYYPSRYCRLEHNYNHLNMVNCFILSSAHKIETFRSLRPALSDKFGDWLTKEELEYIKNLL